MINVSKNILFFIALFFTLQLFTSHTFASIKQTNVSSTPFHLKKVFVKDIKSQSNGIHYRLYLNLPKEYSQTNNSYPIIYLLDADYSFLLAKQIIEHLSDRNRLEKFIIVGISYADAEYKKNRTRDYTPSFTLDSGYGPEYQKYSGGAKKFSTFISKELKPYLAKHYRIKNDTTFVGHSFGGLFGIYLLLNHPETFDKYIIVSPSLWYDNHLLLNLAKNKPSFNLMKPTSLSLFIGEHENGGDYRMVDDIKALNQTLHNKSHKNLLITFNIIPDMDHDTLFPSALTLGLMEEIPTSKIN